MLALNLLHYPSLARQQKLFHRCWTSMVGLLLGGMVALGWLQWQDIQTQSLQQTQTLLQASLTALKQQSKEAALGQTQSRLQTAQLLQLEQIVQHQQAWLSLHDLLHAQARHQGVQLNRMQSDAEKIEFHGTAAHVAAMTDVQQSLSDQLDHPLGLVSITTGAYAGVDFVWQTHLPAVQGASTALLSRPSGPPP